jgi:hypothetical protein
MPTATRSSVSNSKRVRRNKIVTTVNLEPEVLTYLGALQSEFERDRSYLVNALIKDFKRRREQMQRDAARELFPNILTSSVATA